jgi:hypothetical protein
MTEDNWKVALDDRETLMEKPPRVPFAVWNRNGIRFDGNDLFHIFIKIGSGRKDVQSVEQITPAEWIRTSFLWYCSEYYSRNIRFIF